MDKNARVVVTGYGGNCSLGENVDEIWSSISNYKLGYRYDEHPDSSVTASFFGNAGVPRGIKSIPKAINRCLPRYAQFGVVATKEAIDMAFADQSIDKFYDPFECGVIFGTGWGDKMRLLKIVYRILKRELGRPSQILKPCIACVPLQLQKYGI